MSNRFLTGSIVLLAACFLASCTMRTYVQDRGRVDQEMSGNAGCLQGTCPEVDRGDLKQTRKTYVLEIVTGPKKIEAAKSTEPAVTEEVVEEEEIYVSRGGDEAIVVAEETVVTYTDYKIEEGDTLQKISKKFYGTYSRWNEIYQANKDVLTSPDRIKPGKVIRVPQK